MSVPSRQSHTHPAFSYAIGPIDPAQITSLHVQLSSDEACTLLIPVQVPPSMRVHPKFKQGYTWSYTTEGDYGEEEWTVPGLVNQVYEDLAELYDKHTPDMTAWTLGFLLGILASVAERDKTLAFTGLAHVCFLLPLSTQKRPADWPHYELYHAAYFHRDAVKTYRARVRAYRKQGQSYAEAQRLALTGSVFAPVTALSQELVKFDVQQMENPEISGIEYQQGTLAGYEVREYLLEKWKRTCTYCGAQDVPLQVEHIQAKANGGTDRISNLCLACEKCNSAKGTQDIRVFLSRAPDLLGRILAQTKTPLKDAAAVNATRWLRFVCSKTA